MRRAWQYAWASPNSAIGLTLAALALRPRRLRLVDGVLEAHGPLLRWLLARMPLAPHGVAAMTLGHVVIGRDPRTLDATRSHERIHVAQYERWGALFLPAYVGSSLWALLRGGHPYFDNAFEREALRRDAGAEAPALPSPSPGTRALCREAAARSPARRTS